ncbi:hypothetical protein F5884DRAFT_317451 [Xylogone sp. PMI_703]|nr:hypothetical protein F5884DRAFT_317451 [Xylogone sp. PMI_703]
MHCEWPACKKESFLDKEQFTLHLHRHRDEVRDNFVVLGTCGWPGCQSGKSGVTFRTKADFDRHLKRHIKLFWCNTPGCKYRKGFARQHDLIRHMKSHSKEHEFKCPDSSCPSVHLGFPRKDKLDAHIKIRHPHLMNIVQSHRCNIHGCKIKASFDSIEDLKIHLATSHEHSRPHRCPVQSCTRHSNGFTTWGKLIEHIKVGHNPPKCTFDHCDFRSLGDPMVEHNRRAHPVGWHYRSWECNLPGCEGSRSAFTSERLRSHLADHHGINKTYSFLALEAAGDGDMSYFNDPAFVLCKYCSRPRAECDQNELSMNDSK